MLPGRSSFAILGCAALAGLLTLSVAALIGLSSSFSDPDESAHYVNTLFLGDWLRSGAPVSMAFARDYYAHFPKLSIGHWPPGWYALLAPLFAAVRPSPYAAHLLSAFVAGLPAGLILWGAWRYGSARAGLLAAAAYLVMPLVVDGTRHFLLDQPVTLVAGLAVVAWRRAAERPTWANLLLFALIAAAAPLVKGNGALIALVPAIDVAIGRRWRLLHHPALWASGIVALALVAPWYWLSFKISAAGFNYAPGPGYAWLALTSNAASIVANVGLAGIALAVIGSVAAWRSRADRPEKWRIASLALSVVLAALLFQSLVPAALEPRYMSPLLPWLMLLAAIGLVESWREGSTAVRIAAAGLALVTLVPAARNLAALAPDPDVDAPQLARYMQARPGIWLLDGRAAGEGAVIAAAAYADGGKRLIWVARASQWLSRSDFMGRDYAVTARTPAEARAVLDRIGVRGIVSIAIRNRPSYPHSTILRRALNGPDFARANVRFRFGTGSSLVGMRLAPVAGRADLLGAGSGSSGFAGMGAALHR